MSLVRFLKSSLRAFALLPIYLSVSANMSNTCLPILQQDFYACISSDDLLDS